MRNIEARPTNTKAQTYAITFPDPLGVAAPPTFHLDDENLDPKTWCRFPILSGGFERELGELREYVRVSTGR